MQGAKKIHIVTLSILFLLAIFACYKNTENLKSKESLSSFVEINYKYDGKIEKLMMDECLTQKNDGEVYLMGRQKSTLRSIALYVEKYSTPQLYRKDVKKDSPSTVPLVLFLRDDLPWKKQIKFIPTINSDCSIEVMEDAPHFKGKFSCTEMGDDKVSGLSIIRGEFACIAPAGTK